MFKCSMCDYVMIKGTHIWNIKIFARIKDKISLKFRMPILKQFCKIFIFLWHFHLNEKYSLAFLWYTSQQVNQPWLVFSQFKFYSGIETGHVSLLW